jgi:hypothetical protein
MPTVQQGHPRLGASKMTGDREKLTDIYRLQFNAAIENHHFK